MSETDLHDVLLQLIAEHPKATREEIKKLYRAEVMASTALVTESLRRAFSDDYKKSRH